MNVGDRVYLCAKVCLEKHGYYLRDRYKGPGTIRIIRRASPEYHPYLFYLFSPNSIISINVVFDAGDNLDCYPDELVL